MMTYVFVMILLGILCAILLFLVLTTRVKLSRQRKGIIFCLLSCAFFLTVILLLFPDVPHPAEIVLLIAILMGISGGIRGGFRPLSTH